MEEPFDLSKPFDVMDPLSFVQAVRLPQEYEAEKLELATVSGYGQ